MSSVRIRSLSLVALALAVFAGNLAAQDKPSSLLNTPEVQELIKRAEPDDQARLAGHFAALAERYTAEAKRHRAMSQSFAANPARSLGTGMGAHCKQLSDLNTKAATTLRELAAYHQGRTSGATVMPPAADAQFQGGAATSMPSDLELSAMAAKVGTPAEHHALEEYFLMLAKRDTTEADEHVAFALAYRGTRFASGAEYHDRLAQLARDSSKEATAAAAMHKELATPTQ